MAVFQVADMMTKVNNVTEYMKRNQGLARCRLDLATHFSRGNCETIAETKGFFEAFNVQNTLIRALTEEWDKLPQQLLDNVVQSMVRRVECCITLHGGHIPY
ncbi:hypothetical protein TNCV_2240191 [Trichonephila clavipes]|nr:hypothetical protein TNCV_2240191 [Trichonephila clavipes]